MTPTIPRISIIDEAMNALSVVTDFFDRACQAVVAEDTIREVQKECWQIAEDHGFHGVGQSFGDKLMLIVSEAAEALEDFRDGLDPSTYYYEDAFMDHPGKPCGIPSELADIVIRVFDTAEGYGIDLQKVIGEKMAYNRGREWLHGRLL